MDWYNKSRNEIELPLSNSKPVSQVAGSRVQKKKQNCVKKRKNRYLCKREKFWRL